MRAESKQKKKKRKEKGGEKRMESSSSQHAGIWPRPPFRQSFRSTERYRNKRSGWQSRGWKPRISRNRCAYVMIADSSASRRAVKLMHNVVVPPLLAPPPPPRVLFQPPPFSLARTIRKQRRGSTFKDCQRLAAAR